MSSIVATAIKASYEFMKEQNIKHDAIVDILCEKYEIENDCSAEFVKKLVNG